MDGLAQDTRGDLTRQLDGPGTDAPGREIGDERPEGCGRTFPIGTAPKAGFRYSRYSVSYVARVLGLRSTAESRNSSVYAPNVTFRSEGSP